MKTNDIHYLFLSDYKGQFERLALYNDSQCIHLSRILHCRPQNQPIPRARRRPYTLEPLRI